MECISAKATNFSAFVFILCLLQAGEYFKANIQRMSRTHQGPGFGCVDARLLVGADYVVYEAAVLLRQEVVVTLLVLQLHLDRLLFSSFPVLLDQPPLRDSLLFV